MEPETPNSQPAGDDVELEIIPRRITMADGRYMIFFTFQTPMGEDSADSDRDV